MIAPPDPLFTVGDTQVHIVRSGACVRLVYHRSRFAANCIDDLNTD